MDHPDIAQGWWAIERDGPMMSRWTNGEAVLPLSAIHGHDLLELHLAGSMIYVEDAMPVDGTELRLCLGQPRLESVSDEVSTD